LGNAAAVAESSPFCPAHLIMNASARALDSMSSAARILLVVG
jgi:hypothetical protein